MAKRRFGSKLAARWAMAWRNRPAASSQSGRSSPSASAQATAQRRLR
ncbi:MAG: hypothetical protein ACRDZ6_08350 [Acidimicrobiales bacterium]